jgi:hypothetical protein
VNDGEHTAKTGKDGGDHHSKDDGRILVLLRRLDLQMLKRGSCHHMPDTQQKNRDSGIPADESSDCPILSWRKGAHGDTCRYRKQQTKMRAPVHRTPQRSLVIYGHAAPFWRSFANSLALAPKKEERIDRSLSC